MKVLGTTVSDPHIVKKNARSLYVLKTIRARGPELLEMRCGT